MLQEFERRTSYAVLINTSFNLRGEPIVCSPEDAYRCFVGIGDYLRRHCLLAVAARSPSGRRRAVDFWRRLCDSLHFTRSGKRL
jgi:carbamoyltransferase